MSNHNSARPHPNDKQEKGFRTTAEAAQNKYMRKFLASKVTHQELIATEQKVGQALGSVINAINFILDNVDGLKEKFNEEITKQQEAAAQQLAPNTAADANGGAGSEPTLAADPQSTEEGAVA